MRGIAHSLGVAPHLLLASIPLTCNTSFFRRTMVYALPPSSLAIRGTNLRGSSAVGSGGFVQHTSLAPRDMFESGHSQGLTSVCLSVVPRPLSFHVLCSMSGSSFSFLCLNKDSGSLSRIFVFLCDTFLFLRLPGRSSAGNVSNPAASSGSGSQSEGGIGGPADAEYGARPTAADGIQGPASDTACHRGKRRGGACSCGGEHANRGTCRGYTAVYAQARRGSSATPQGKTTSTLGCRYRLCKRNTAVAGAQWVLVAGERHPHCCQG